MRISTGLSRQLSGTSFYCKVVVAILTGKLFGGSLDGSPFAWYSCNVITLICHSLWFFPGTRKRNVPKWYAEVFSTERYSVQHMTYDFIVFIYSWKENSLPDAAVHDKIVRFLYRPNHLCPKVIPLNPAMGFRGAVLAPRVVGVEARPQMPFWDI